MWGEVKGTAGGVAGGLVFTAWIAPIAAAVVTIAVFLGWHPLGMQQLNAVEVGPLAAVALWAVLGVIVAPVSSSKAHANPDSWGLASVRIRDLQGQLMHLDPTSPRHQAAQIEANAEIEKIQSPAFCRHGLRWQTRSGYIALWRSIHHAEEAVIEAADETHLRRVVDAYWWRVEGAKGSPPPVARIEDARSRLRTVVAAVNEMRDDSWAGLVRLRLQTLAALFLTEVSAYGLLALVVSLSGGSRPADVTHPVVTGIVYFGVAPVVGFFARLLALSNSGTAVDDYGLQTARLLLVPVVSGLAGLGGVVLTIMLAATSLSSLIVASGSRLAGGGLPSLADVLNLGTNPAGLVFAIVFGYAPNLLLARLDSLVATYKTAIKSTEPAGTQQSPV